MKKAISSIFLLLPFVLSSVIQTYNLTGSVPDNGFDHFFLPFFVPAGTVEVQVDHVNLTPGNILDWGLNDTRGFRGWGGGNVETVVVNEEAASRSYLTGAVESGTWAVVVGKAKIDVQPGQYAVQVTLRNATTLAPQTNRQPYAPVAPLKAGPAWFAGDFHVHSWQSGDATPTLDAIASLAVERGLQFVMISDHNTNAQLDYFLDAQSRWPELLFVPGVEYTTYYGHAGGIGATQWVDHKIGLPNVTIQAAAQAFADQGALLSINHFDMYEGGAFNVENRCIGCAWDFLELDNRNVHAMEIGIQGWEGIGWIFSPHAIEWWDHLQYLGFQLTPVGGSDDHHAGVNESGILFNGTIVGNPTTMVFAANLSAHAIVDGVRNGRTVVKLYGPDDPMVELTSVPAADPSTQRITLAANASALLFQVMITGGSTTDTLYLRRNNQIVFKYTVMSSSDWVQFEAPGPDSGTGTDRWRAEIYTNSMPRVITSHLLVKVDAAG